jgi:DUF1009 family protein
MLEKIVCKIFNTKYKIGITESGKVLAVLSDKIVECDKVVHMGSIHYRPKFTNKRISAKSLNRKQFLIKNKEIQQYCPF